MELVSGSRGELTFCAPNMGNNSAVEVRYTRVLTKGVSVVMWNLKCLSRIAGLLMKKSQLDKQKLHIRRSMVGEFAMTWQGEFNAARVDQFSVKLTTEQRCIRH